MVRNRSKRKQYKETARSRYWRRMMAGWERSDLTQAEFCRRKGLSRAAFAWWRHRFKTARVEEENRGRMLPRSDERNGRRKKEKESESATPLFIPVEVKSGIVRVRPGVVGDASGEGSERMSGDRIEVILASGHRLRVPDGFHSETLVRLVEVLEGSC